MGTPRGETPRSPSRLIAVDAARALAIAGMIVANVGPVGAEGILGGVWSLPVGRASVLFVVLAGLSFSLMTRSVRGSGTMVGLGPAWGVIAWRASLLLALGLGLGMLDHSVSIILPAYALLFVIGGLLLLVPDRVLLALAAVSLALGPALWLLANPSGRDRIAELGGSPLALLESLALTGYYPVVTWIVPFAFGLWLGRRDLRDRRRLIRLLIGGATTAVLATVAGLVGTALAYDPDRPLTLLITAAGHGQMPLWLLSSTATATAIVAALLLVGLGGERRLRWLAATGQLALTIYIAHVLVLAAIGDALTVTLPVGILLSAVLIVVAVAFSVVWRARFARGPLELLLRPLWAWRRPHPLPVGDGGSDDPDTRRRRELSAARQR